MENWKYVKNDLDIKEFSNYFYDACLKELWYESGMYVDENLTMQPINKKRNLHIIFQNQYKENNVMEVVFKQVDEFSLKPQNNNNYDDIINGIYMCFEEDKLVWFGSDYYEKNYKELYNNCSYVRSKEVKYRFLENILGNNSFYKIKIDNTLLNNLDKIHTTKMGIDRIKKNLNLDLDDAVNYIVNKVKSSNALIERKGKNWYVTVDGIVITINAYSYTIITAHKFKNID